MNITTKRIKIDYRPTRETQHNEHNIFVFCFDSSSEQAMRRAARAAVGTVHKSSNEIVKQCKQYKFVIHLLQSRLQ